jgi:predicted kinase
MSTSGLRTRSFDVAPCIIGRVTSLQEESAEASGPRRSSLGRRTLIVTRGLPGAGKTTRALHWVAEDPERRARVGSDQIAAMLHPHALVDDGALYAPHYAKREQLVVNAAIEVLLRSGIDVVCDDPFWLSHYLQDVRELAEQCEADLVIWDMTDVDVNDCIVRDQRRGQAGGRSVGETGIRRQHRLYHRQLSRAVRDGVRELDSVTSDGVGDHVCP